MLESTETLVTAVPRGAVMLLWIDNPPVNALGVGVRQGLATSLAAANADPAMRAVAILARGRSFPVGADISEFDQPPQAPSLPDLCNMIEASPKPVVVGLHGMALGGGLELALAAHGRVALADTKLGLPEVGLGILPGAGGTQRLPRLIGAQEALRMMITGKPVSAVEALAMGILDNVVEQDLTEATVAWALNLAPKTPVPTHDRRDGIRDPKAYFAAIAEARRLYAGAAISAPARIIDCVEAAQLLPFDQGLAYEAAAFSELVSSTESVALRHVFFAERRAAKMVGSTAKPLPVAEITVLGAGGDGVSLTHELLSAGYQVTLVDTTADALTTGLEALATLLAAELERQSLTQAEHDDRWARLLAALPGDDGDAADMLFLTGAFRLPKAEVPLLSVKAGAPIVTLGRVGDGGMRGLGLALQPATANGRLAEVLISDSTAPDAIATLLAVVKRLGRQVVQGQGAGIVAGLAVALNASLQAQEDQHGAAPVLDLLARWGMPRAQDRSTPKPQGKVNLWSGIAPQVMAALANAGLRLIGDGKALRPSDVDLAMIVGLGFPRWGGGPMLWAQHRGLMVLRDNLNHLAMDAPDVWEPAPLLDDLIRQGISLVDLNAD
jgi:3-hydroxyacyl-CoA dehydrogenase